MTETDAVLTVDTTHGHEPIRVVRDGAEQEPDEREHWWPVFVSDGPDGSQWESWL